MPPLEPRLHTLLYLVYFFAGKVLEGMPSEEVRSWADAVRRCVAGKTNKGTMLDYSM